MPPDQQQTERQREQETGDERNSNILSFSAICNPAGKTRRCGKQIERKRLKNRLQHGVIISEGGKINGEIILFLVMKDAAANHGIQSVKSMETGNSHCPGQPICPCPSRTAQ